MDIDQKLFDEISKEIQKYEEEVAGVRMKESQDQWAMLEQEFE